MGPSSALFVEGPRLFPSFVAPLVRERDQAPFLVSRPEEQRERLLARGPITRTSQPQLARNQVRLFRATGHAPSGYPVLRFGCECGRLGCSETVELGLDAAAAGSIVAGGCTP